MPKTNEQLKATQEIISIADIRDNLVVLENGELRAVLKVSGINFNLYSTRERERVLYAFQTFLNGLDFPIQILVQSRSVNLNAYLEKLKDASLKQPTEALRLETYEYINFIQQLARLGTIMDKSFYVIVSFSPVPTAPKGILEKLTSIFFKPKKEVILTEFEKSKKKLLEKTQIIASTLAGIGLEAIQLTSPELIELFFSSYNPGTQVKNGEALEQLQSLWTQQAPPTEQ